MDFYEAVIKLSLDEYKVWWRKEFTKLLEDRFNDRQFFKKLYYKL